MNRRQQIALGPEEQREYLDESHTIILVSNDRHGYPHPVAMWYLAEPDGSVVMTTFRKSQKALNLRRDPRCTLLIESGRTYPELKGLIIRGRAEIDDDTERVLDVFEAVQPSTTRVQVEGLRDISAGRPQAVPHSCATRSGSRAGITPSSAPACTDLLLPDCIVLFVGRHRRGGGQCVAGGGSLITFPLLVCLGRRPIVANATNTVSLSPGSLAAL